MGDENHRPNLIISTIAEEPSKMMVSDEPSPLSSLEQRLLQLKSDVEKAMEEAIQRTDPVSERVLQSDDPNASFHLGLEIFSSSENPAHLEKSIQENLSLIERKFKDLAIEIRVRQQQQQEDAENEFLMQDDISNDLAAAGNQFNADFLKVKLRFLKQCSQVRKLIEEAAALADPNNSFYGSAVAEWARAMEKLLEAKKEWEQANEILQAEWSRAMDSSVDSSNSSGEQHELKKAHRLMELLRQDIRNPKVEILHQVQTAWHNCIVLEPETIHIRGFQPAVLSSPVSLDDEKRLSILDQIYIVLELLNEREGHTLWEELLLPFANQLYDQVMAPVLEMHKKPEMGVVCWQFHELQERGVSTTLSVVTSSKYGMGMGMGAVKTLEWARDEEKTMERDPIAAWTETISFLQRILVFIADYGLVGRTKFCNLFGQRLLGRPVATTQGDLRLYELGLTSFRLGNDHGILMGPLVDLMKDTCIPDYVPPNNLGLLRETQTRLEAIVQPFLKTMRQKGLLTEDEYSCPLQLLVTDFLQNYIHHRHSLKLNQSRNLILHNDYHNTRQVGVDPSTRCSPEDKKLGLDNGMDVFLLHKSCVSNTAYQLFQQCLECMDESVEYAVALHKTDDRTLADLPATLYQVARQVLDLYRAIVPVRYGKEAAQVPRTAAIFYNDCVYFAHHCLSLGIRYREKYPDAQDSPSKVLRRICIFVDKVPLFRDMADRCMRQMLERQAHQIQDLVQTRIGLLAPALRSEDILAEWADAETALNAGLYHLRHVAQQWKPILAQNIFDSTVGYLANILFTLFLEPVLAAKDYSTAACEFVHDLFGKALDGVHNLLESRVESVQAWDRFRAVGRFMDMSLADVEAALSDGVFTSVTGQELTMLLLAAHDESSRRQNLLKLLNKVA